MNGDGHYAEDLADDLHAAGKNEELLALAKKLWPTSSSDPLPDGVAEVCRLARVAALRLRDSPPAGGPTSPEFSVEVDLWEAHGLTAAVLSHATHVVAGFLLPRFYTLCDMGAFSAAREVVDDMLRLVAPGSDQRPFERVVRRFCSEKRAYSYFLEGRFADALQCYHEALAHTTPGMRAALKVQGGLALTEFMASARGNENREKLRDTLQIVAADAQVGGFPDVAEWATRNLAQVDAGTADAPIPFELT